MNEATRRTLRILEEMCKEKQPPKKRRKYQHISAAYERYHYRIPKRKLVAKAKELGVYIKIGAYAYLNMDVLDQYFHVDEDPEEDPVESSKDDYESLEDILSNINP